ncbi:metallophosphoesterase [Tamlana sedimentorum]|uniref:Metallophosphoesterase n=1 Tax=Neotamlana sedimentorum TaxID=1435349 RepID=A0A0D7WE45_9FLAO|nr:calcineurin-like phosphoesterase family protein [Tamlana sedimentorum]KJD36973.1 metallophosphoesterase [Tamlana sedimentorum]
MKISKIKLLITTVIFGVTVMQTIAQNKVTGYVFHDANSNGKKETNEKGIESIAVTNGKEVVLTNAKGVYQLPLTNDAIISVIKPSNYKVAVNANNLPQFFYIHKPKGSPKLKFKGVEATGKLPRNVNFPLIASEENEVFTALIFGDPQPYTQQQVDYFAKGIVEEVANIKNIPFGLSLGDLVGNDLSLFNPYIKATKKAGIPWYNVLGNHDLNFDVETDALSDETYEAHFGPANYAFNYGKVHFIIIDNVLYPDPRKESKYWGGFREDQFQFLENDLKYVPKDHLIILAMHIPLSEPDDNDTFNDEHRQRLFNLLKPFSNTLSLSAHTHIQRQDFFTNAQGWPQEKPHHHYNVGTTSGDWYSGKLDANKVPTSTMRDGTPKGYAFINFNGNSYSVDYKVAGKPKTHQMEIFAPKVVAKDKKTKAAIYVNFFMGSPSDEVLYKIDGGEWNAMKYTTEPDPSYVSQIINWDESETLIPGKRASNAIDCTHLWKGKILTKLSAGTHTIEVKATDMFGKTHYGSKTYRVEQSNF